MPDDLGSLTEAERDAVGQVFLEHQPFIESVARRHACSPADVDDIVQNVAVSLCRNLQSFRGASMLKSWLFRVTVNTARTHFRNQSRRERTRTAFETLVPQPPVENPDDIVRQGERLEALREAVARLKPSQQAVVSNLLSESGVKADKGFKSRAFNVRHALRIRLANDCRLD